jgi:hypothetical protein
MILLVGQINEFSLLYGMDQLPVRAESSAMKKGQLKAT